MKDLKYIHYFTKLLDDPNNELVKKGIENGKIALGYTCYHVPEVLLNLDRGFSTRLRAPKLGGLEISTYYMSNYTCEYARALVEKGVEGAYNYLSAFLSAETCSEMNRAAEHFELLSLNSRDKFFVSFLDVPTKTGDLAVSHYANQVKAKILKPLHEVYGIDISDESMLKAVELQNKINAILTEMSELRKEDNPRITGTEFHLINMVASSCPKDLIIDKLEETLQEVKVREKDVDNKYRARVAVVGSEIDDNDLISLIEGCGALVVADRFCFGAFPGREPIIIKKDQDVLTQIVSYYMYTSQCPRYMTNDKVLGRHRYVKNLVESYHADGVIYQLLKFCEFWGYERPLASHVIESDFGIPTVSIDRDYRLNSMGQLRTRIQAFVESLEIKKINAKGESK